MLLRRVFGGVGVVFGVLVVLLMAAMMTAGGYRSSSPRPDNTDPRSVGVELVVLDYPLLAPDGSESPGAAQLRGLLDAGGIAEAPVFDELLLAARTVSSEPASSGQRAAELRTPTLLVQHGERAVIELDMPGKRFVVDTKASVLDKDIIRVVLNVRAQRAIGGDDHESVAFETTFTSDGRIALISDQGSATGEPGRGLIIAARPTLAVKKPG